MPNQPKGKVLGPEWGNLAGLPAEEALKYVAQYAADLEQKVGSASSGGEKGGAKDDGGDDPNSLEIAKNLNFQSKAPLGAEFVGRREAARRTARQQVEALGYDWNKVEATVESAMSGAAAEQQTNSQAWVAAFVYAHGQADIMARAAASQKGTNAGDDPNSPPRDEYDDDVVIMGGMNADRGARGPMGSAKPKIEDPVERNTKRQFEKVLGYRISDEEWVALQDPDRVKTEEDWNELQTQLKSKGGR